MRELELYFQNPTDIRHTHTRRIPVHPSVFGPLGVTTTPYSSENPIFATKNIIVQPGDAFQDRLSSRGLKLANSKRGRRFSASQGFVK
jgi:hypothetical protein